MVFTTFKAQYGYHTIADLAKFNKDETPPFYNILALESGYST